MGIDIHALNFIKLQSSLHPLGKVLTIGRQSLSVDPEVIEKNLGKIIKNTGYCEPFLLALNAESAESLDFSDYEDATYVADLNNSLNINVKFDTIIDSGSLEHIFDVAAAFRNIINLCKVGGRIIHFLPVNNLNGHGFWQFSSDLLYSIYSEKNGFAETDVYYASSLDSSHWYKVPEAKPGVRIEIVSLEPIILLSVARKVHDVISLSVMQPFYVPVWSSENSPSILPVEKKLFSINKIAKKFFGHRGLLINSIRNFYLIFGLMTGSSHFSINNSKFLKIRVEQVLRGQGI